MSAWLLYRDANGKWVRTSGGHAWPISLHPADIKPLTQKGNTLSWLRMQPKEMVFAPNSVSQCVYGRMFRQIFGDHGFGVSADTVWWDTGKAEVTVYAEYLQQALLNYLGERDGWDANDDPIGTHITRDEAIKIAKEVRV